MKQHAIAFIILGLIWTLPVILSGKHIHKEVKPLLLFAGGFCFGFALCIYLS